MTDRPFEPEFVATLVELSTDGKPVELVSPPGYPECEGWLASSRPVVVESQSLLLAEPASKIVGVGQHPCLAVLWRRAQKQRLPR